MSLFLSQYGRVSVSFVLLLYDIGEFVSVALERCFGEFVTVAVRKSFGEFLSVAVQHR